MKKTIKSLLAVLLAFVVVMETAGCGYSDFFGIRIGKSELVNTITDLEESDCDSDVGSTEYNEDFQTFIDDLFAKIMSDEDTISIHAYIENPENFGIDDYDVSLGRIDYDNLGSTDDYDEILAALDEFDYDTLSDKQKLVYDELYQIMINERDNADLYLLSSDIMPTTGIQVELPLLFAEYTFVEKKDIDEYLLLVEDVDGYFEDILKYEKLRADVGYFMEDDLAQEVIDTCNSFVETALSEDGVMISSFNEKIDAFDGLTDEQKENYKAANVTAITEHVVKGYKLLAEGVASLMGTNKYSGGICNYPDGDRYFEYLMESRLGWNMSIDEYYDLGKNYIASIINQMNTIISNDYSAYKSMSSFSFGITDPDEILQTLKEKIGDSFPEIADTTYTIQYVSEALEDYASPAMYFIPQIDNLDVNSIYINPSSDEDDLFATLAHEGYPGHLYQTQYFASTNPDYLRYILAPSGYLEGWASYAEVFSYSYVDSGNENLNELMGLNYEVILIIYAMGDIGVNYYGWDIDDLKSFVNTYYSFGTSTIQNMYNAFIANPGNYCKYAFGMVGIYELKSKAMDELGDSFDIKEFHKYILDMGPIQFDILFDNLDAWIKEQLDIAM